MSWTAALVVPVLVYDCAVLPDWTAIERMVLLPLCRALSTAAVSAAVPGVSEARKALVLAPEILFCRLTAALCTFAFHCE